MRTFSPKHVFAMAAATVVSAASAQIAPRYVLSAPVTRQNALFGASIADAGDVDGDGFGDVIVGTEFETATPSPLRAGRAYVYSGATGNALWTLVSTNEMVDGGFGQSVAGAGDIDGDGHADLIVGAPGESSGTSPAFAGRAYLISGATSAVLRTFASPNEVSIEWFGGTVSASGDVDGDGRNDIAVGASRESPGSAPELSGMAYIFSSATGDALFDRPSPDPQELGQFGWALASTGDLDGDGKPDMTVGAPGEWGPGRPIYAGSGHVISSTGARIRTLQSPNEQTDANFGNSIADIGDLDGDSARDLAVGAYREGTLTNPIETGQAYVFSGSDGALLFTLASPNEMGTSAFGTQVAAGGDINGDGLPDILVSAPGEPISPAQLFSGRVYAFLAGTVPYF